MQDQKRPVRTGLLGRLTELLFWGVTFPPALFLPLPQGQGQGPPPPLPPLLPGPPPAPLPPPPLPPPVQPLRRRTFK